MGKHESAPIPVVLQFLIDGQAPGIAEALRGPEGRSGLQGPQGDPGMDSSVPGPEGKQGPVGPDGLSIVGPPGPRGFQGEPGIEGPPGWSPSKEALKALIKEVLAGL